MANMVIAGKHCEHCIHGTPWDDGKTAKIYCENRDRDYYYGQYVPCDDYKKYENPEDLRKM